MTKPRTYKKTLAAAFFLTLAPLVLSQAPFRRSEAFFGLHFDLHPSDSDTDLGADVTEDMVGRLLRRVKPDYVQLEKSRTIPMPAVRRFLYCLVSRFTTFMVNRFPTPHRNDSDLLSRYGRPNTHLKLLSRFPKTCQEQF